MIGAMIFLALPACTQEVGTSAQPATATPTTPSAVDEVAPTPAPSKTHGIAIGTIVTHGARVSILGGGTELRYVVRGADGAMVADGLTLDELRAKDPLLSEIVRSATASRGTWLDASR